MFGAKGRDYPAFQASSVGEVLRSWPSRKMGKLWIH